MKYIIDTNVLIWYPEKSTKLSDLIYDILNDSENKIFVSLATIWELAIKLNLGKIKITEPFEDFISNYIYSNDIQLLEISLSHLYQISQLENFIKTHSTE